MLSELAKYYTNAWRLERSDKKFELMRMTRAHMSSMRTQKSRLY